MHIFSCKMPYAKYESSWKSFIDFWLSAPQTTKIQHSMVRTEIHRNWGFVEGDWKLIHVLPEFCTETGRGLIWIMGKFWFSFKINVSSKHFAGGLPVPLHYVSSWWFQQIWNHISQNGNLDPSKNDIVSTTTWVSSWCDWVVIYDGIVFFSTSKSGPGRKTPNKNPCASFGNLPVVFKTRGRFAAWKPEIQPPFFPSKHIPISRNSLSNPWSKFMDSYELLWSFSYGRWPCGVNIYRTILGSSWINPRFCFKRNHSRLNLL